MKMEKSKVNIFLDFFVRDFSISDFADKLSEFTMRGAPFFWGEKREGLTGGFSTSRVCSKRDLWFPKVPAGLGQVELQHSFCCWGTSPTVWVDRPIRPVQELVFFESANGNCTKGKGEESSARSADPSLVGETS
jgi:hypothetical protein